MATNIFYNREERRVRAPWRLLIQMLVFLGSSVVTGFILGIALMVISLVRGDTSLDMTTLDNLFSYPLARIISAVSSLLFMWISYLVASRWLDHRPIRDFGFHLNRRWWEDFGFGLFLGAVLMAFIYVVEVAAGWVTVTGTMQSKLPGVGFWDALIASLIAFICVGIYEEMFSRGYQLRNLAEGLNFKSSNPRTAFLIAYLLSSSIFGILHLGNPNATLVSTVNLIIAGLFLGLGYVLTGELAIPIGLHITWNFFQGNVFGFPVSGGSSGVSFIAIQQGGPDVWTGGAFGPEAGLIGLLAIVLGSILTVLWVRWRYGKIELQSRLAVYQPPQKAPAPEEGQWVGETQPEQEAP